MSRPSKLDMDAIPPGEEGEIWCEKNKKIRMQT
jgi:hypothetical protein